MSRFGCIVAQIARDVLAPGPMGNDGLRTDEYREFIRCGFDPAIAKPYEFVDIAGVKTSCAVFVRAVLHHAGRKASRPGRIGQGICNGWLEGMTFYSDSWTLPHKGVQPQPGDVFFREYGLTGAVADGHVGILVEKLPDGRWITAEGGGSLRDYQLRKKHPKASGTVCRLSAAKDIWAKDTLNRSLLGWWRAEILDPHSFRPLAPGNRGPRVMDWQKRLVRAGFDLGRYGVDGVYGGATSKATAALQMQYGLEPTGVVDRETWDLLEPVTLPEGDL